MFVFLNNGQYVTTIVISFLNLRKKQQKISHLNISDSYLFIYFFTFNLHYYGFLFTIYAHYIEYSIMLINA